MTTNILNSPFAFMGNWGKVLRDFGETIYLFLSGLPARRIVLSVIGLLVAIQIVRTVLPFALIFGQWSPLVESIFYRLTEIDLWSPILLYMVLRLTKFNVGDNEVLIDLYWLGLGMIAKQFAWHGARVLVASVMGDFSTMAAYLNWCWLWAVIYGIGLYLMLTCVRKYVLAKGNKSNEIIPSTAKRSTKN